MYGVIESWMIAWERQWMLMRLMFAGLLPQMLFTLALIDRSLLVAQFGMLVAWVTMVAVGAWMVRKQLRTAAT